MLLAFQVAAVCGLVLASVACVLLVGFRAPGLLARPWQKMYHLTTEPVRLVRVLSVLWAIAAVVFGVVFVSDLILGDEG